MKILGQTSDLAKVPIKKVGAKQNFDYDRINDENYIGGTNHGEYQAGYKSKTGT